MVAELPRPGLVCAARYQRRLPTSAARVWENVRDWEHLPWLHRSSFSSIALLDSGAWGWTARVGLQPGNDEAVVELRIDPAEPRYVARTLEGGFRGAEVWTDVRVLSDDATEVDVEFWVPEGNAAAAKEIGRAYLELYRRLWDEDEAMMVRRTAELAAATSRLESAGLCLGPLDEIRPRLPLLVRWEGQPFRVVEIGGELVAHSTRCPHWLGPLEDARVEEGCVVCPWHGYRFDVREGRSTEGRGLRLDFAPVVRVDGDQRAWLESRAL